MINNESKKLSVISKNSEMLISEGNIFYGETFSKQICHQ